MRLTIEVMVRNLVMLIGRLVNMGHYKSKKVEYDGVKFDSISERDYYIRLKNDTRVDDLQVHPKFILLDNFRNSDGKMIRSITFKPDYMYKIDGQLYIEDIKPIKKTLIDADFTLRWKLLQHMYKDQKVIFRLIAWDKSKKEFVEL